MEKNLHRALSLSNEDLSILWNGSISRPYGHCWH
ncbi:TctA family transporter [Pseudomonas sp. BIGb0408]|uniref:TctA family transporter n=1 Tax=Phytopseudomonas flavescens TaxID=29435 RepID=A0A7Y9XIF1_9GAMM|nr:TctA family transporter [Pseudomonas sp. BIGb0408]NYH71973.1 TctA family transporter [Pseudomonas flavescens]